MSQTNPLYQELSQTFVQRGPFSSVSLDKYSPVEIREAVQALMADDNTTLASAVADAALALMPDCPDVLAVAGLLSMTRQDWEGAAEYLVRLIKVQGTAAPAATFMMLARAQRCNLDPFAAANTLDIGLTLHPESDELQQAFDELTACGLPQMAPVGNVLN